ncbi:MAG: hypothetical protein R3C28_12600 [Pirellulaceae bacterium]
MNNAAASILLIASLLVVRDAPHYALFLSVALLWLVSARLQQAKECCWAHQGFLLMAAVAGVHRAIHLQPWYQAVPLGDSYPQAISMVRFGHGGDCWVVESVVVRSTPLPPNSPF